MPNDIDTSYQLLFRRSEPLPTRVRSSRNPSSAAAVERSRQRVAEIHQLKAQVDGVAPRLVPDRVRSSEASRCNLMAWIHVEGDPGCPKLSVVRDISPTRMVLTPSPGFEVGQVVRLIFRMGRECGHSKLTLVGRVLRVWQGGVEVDLDAGTADPEQKAA